MFSWKKWVHRLTRIVRNNNGCKGKLINFIHKLKTTSGKWRINYDGHVVISAICSKRGPHSPILIVRLFWSSAKMIRDWNFAERQISCWWPGLGCIKYLKISGNFIQSFPDFGRISRAIYWIIRPEDDILKREHKRPRENSFGRQRTDGRKLALCSWARSSRHTCEGVRDRVRASR